MGKNFNGTQMNNSPTIVEKAGAEIADCRNRIMKYDGNGDVVLASKLGAVTMQPLSCYSDILGNILRWHDILFYYYYMGRASSSSFFVLFIQF